MKYRYRVGFGKKLILQVFDEAQYYDEDFNGEVKIGWRDARTEDISEGLNLS